MVTENQKYKSDKSIKVIKLEHPFNFGSERISTVEFIRRPKAKDLKGLKLAQQMADDQLILLGRVTNLSTPQLEELDIGDTMLLFQELSNFLPESLRTGPNS